MSLLVSATATGRSFLATLMALALPSTCVVCRRDGEALCGPCLACTGRLGARPAVRTRPDPVPEGLPETWAACPLEGPLRTALTAYKDHGRRDLDRTLAVLLSHAIVAARGDPERALALVPVPGSGRSRRRRGDRPLEHLTVVAAGLLPGRVRVVRALRPVRAVADQSGLDHAARAANLVNAFVADDAVRELLAGHDVVIVDDIMTTGATLAESARALAQVGHQSRAACVAATRRAGHAGAQGRVVGVGEAD